MRKISVGFFGCGNIGGGVWALLENMRADIARCFQIRFEVKKMLVRSLDEQRAEKVPLELLTTDVDDILNDPEISLVCEFMGGEQPAADFMLRALRAGKSVVTANKMALSLHWRELHEAAARTHAKLYYEASVCGAIPVIRTIRESMTGSRINSIFGIVNGTTNYILTEMQQKGLSYEMALSQAQQLGLAEPDPASDVEGYDAAYKLCILSALCFETYIHPNQITRKGITQVDITDICLGEQLGLRLKLLARASCRGQAVNACVSPAFISTKNQLANVNGSFNGVLLHGHASDDIFLYGRGAGSQPTASAVVADMIQAVRTGTEERSFVLNDDLELDSLISQRCYVRVNADCAQNARQIAQSITAAHVQAYSLTTDEKTYTVLITEAISLEMQKKLMDEFSRQLGVQAVIWPVEGEI